ncbi:MAG: hypothetical protein ABIA75_01760 [Candidatus Neomarinimicrobiota bacterium]
MRNLCLPGLLLGCALLLAQPADSLIVKYFPTELTRGMILDQASDYRKVKNGPHFRAYYSPQGDLIQVEYVPAPGDRSDQPPPVAKTGPRQHFSQWNPWQRKLIGPLAANELSGRRHYAVEFDKQGQISRIEFVNGGGKPQWTYHVRWNQAHTRSVYQVEFHVHQSLLALDRFLFASELCEMRPGWTALFELRRDGRPQKVEIQDDHGQSMYFYRFTYGKDGPTRIISADYFRSNRVLLGCQELYFAPGSSRPNRIDYLAADRRLKKSVTYDWDTERAEVTVTETDAGGSLLGRRVLKTTLN